MSESTVGGFTLNVHLTKLNKPEPSNHFDERMHLTLEDMKGFWGEPWKKDPLPLVASKA